MAIQSGGINVGKYGGSDDSDWNLLATTGDRDYEKAISFPTEFANTPVVMVSLRGQHVLQGEDCRVAVGSSDVTTTGFVLHVVTWEDTSVAGVGVNWIAFDSVLDGI